MIPAEAVEAAAKWLHDNNCRSALHSGFPADEPCYAWMDEATELLEAAIPHMNCTPPTDAERDELIELIWQDAVDDRTKSGKNPRNAPVVRSKVEALADHIIAAGWRK